MASEITNKSSGQVMRVCFTVFSLDSLSLCTIKFSNDYSIQSPTCYISFNRDKYIEETSKLPIFPSRKRVHALSMQWNLNRSNCFRHRRSKRRSWLLLFRRSNGFQPDRKLQFLVSRHLLPDNYSKTAVIEVYSGRQLLLRFPATYPSCPSKSFSLPPSLSLCLLLFLSYHRNSRLACFTRLSSANNARSFVDLSN